MQIGLLEGVALLIILFALIKLITVSISMEKWLNFSRKLYVNPKLTSVIAWIVALFLLFVLIRSGMTATQLVVVWALFGAMIAASFAQYGNLILDWAGQRTLVDWLREQWAITLLWLVLMIWALVEIIS